MKSRSANFLYSITNENFYNPLIAKVLGKINMYTENVQYKLLNTHLYKYAQFPIY